MIYTHTFICSFVYVCVFTQVYTGTLGCVCRDHIHLSILLCVCVCTQVCSGTLGCVYQHHIHSSILLCVCVHGYVVEHLAVCAKIAYIRLCVCVYMCVHRCVVAHLAVCAKINFRCHPPSFFTSVFKARSLWAWSSLCELDWLVREPQESAYFGSASTRVQVWADPGIQLFWAASTRL